MYGGLDVNWNYKSYNFDDKIQADYKTTSLGRLNYEWVLNDLEAFEPEIKMPAHSNFMKYLQFAPTDWESWDDIANLYYCHYFCPELKITSEIKEKAMELTKGVAIEKEKIENLHEFVKSMRYVNISLSNLVFLLMLTTLLPGRPKICISSTLTLINYSKILVGLKKMRESMRFSISILIIYRNKYK